MKLIGESKNCRTTLYNEAAIAEIFFRFLGLSLKYSRSAGNGEIRLACYNLRPGGICDLGVRSRWIAACYSAIFPSSSMFLNNSTAFGSKCVPERD